MIMSYRMQTTAFNQCCMAFATVYMLK